MLNEDNWATNGCGKGWDMIAADRSWHKVKGASAITLMQLKAVAPAELPSTYFELLAWSNGGEGPLPVHPLNFCLYGAEEVIESERNNVYKESFPSLFVFGSNGAGEAIAFDLRGTKPWCVVHFDMVNTDLEESVLPIASNFEAFLQLVGQYEN